MTSTLRAADKPDTAPPLTLSRFEARARPAGTPRRGAGRLATALVAAIALVAVAVPAESAAAESRATGLLPSAFISATGFRSQAFHGGGQRLLIPAYFHPNEAHDPNGGSERWTKMCTKLHNRGLTAVIVMNPGVSGVFPIGEIEEAYADAIDFCHTRGQRVVGYVDTKYAARPLEGAPIEDLPSVKDNVDRYYSSYPAIDGIFLDQMNEHDTAEDYYRDLSVHIRLKKIGHFGTLTFPLVVGNAGKNPDSNWALSTVTILVNFEGPYSRFGTWTPSEWVDDYPARRFAHLVYRTRAKLATTACKRSRNQRGGWIYVTYDILPNPWNKPPYAAFLECPTLNRPPEVAP
jgi:hypothetical protein